MASWPNESDSVFGMAVGGHHVDAAVTGILMKWSYSYLDEVAKRSGEEEGELKGFKSYRVSSELEHMPEDQVPTCIIANMGLSEVPSKYGGNRPGQHFQAQWRYRIGCHVSARGRKFNAASRAITLAKMYCLAVRLCLIQKRDEYDDPARPTLLGMTDWVDEDYGTLDSQDDRTICLAYAEFLVNVNGVATWANGPETPVVEPTPESPEWPIALKITPDFIKVPTEETIGGE